MIYEDKQLFDFMLRRVRDVGGVHGLKAPQAFGRWFADLYFQNPRDFFISDGSGDGKVDLFFQRSNGHDLEFCVLNTKFTERYNSPAPVAFYDELTRFWQAFANKGNRDTYLSSIVRPELKRHYSRLFGRYDEGRAQLYFVTNSRRNNAQAQATAQCKVEVFHLEDILQFMVDYIEDAMPHTAPLLLTGISTVLTAGEEESTVPTSIVFARLTDFIDYMEDDPFDLLFARNVRLWLGNTPVNEEIRNTFVVRDRHRGWTKPGAKPRTGTMRHWPRPWTPFALPSWKRQWKSCLVPRARNRVQAGYSQHSIPFSA